MKKLRLILIWGTAWLLCVIPAQAQELPQVLIINQVRGTQCCESGTAQVFQEQLELLTKLQLPATFTLRWDALTNPDFINIIHRANSQLFTWGIFLEITPQLAEAAGVSYTGTPDNWYQAQHAYILGYSSAERRQIVDTLIKQYQVIFNDSPALTTSWIIDTPTLNYVHDEYGVEVHQLTREQWGTDSYTLYGGPPHYPYPASRHWALMPDFAESNSPLIVRQTLTDPVWNYGDTQSRFTSQPNDFSQDGKGFTYFQQLFDQALFHQPADQLGFALIGLENSTVGKYQALFHQQLQLISDYYQQGEISLPNLATLRQTWLDQQLRIYQGQDFVKNSFFQATWITSPSYRLRLIRQGTQLCLDDLRLYDPQLEDYYAQHQAQDSSYWVAPFLLDGSRYYIQPAKFLQKETASDGSQPLPDPVTEPECWQLPDLASTQTRLRFQATTDRNLTLSYERPSGSEETYIFQPTQFRLPLASDDVRLKWQTDSQVAYQLHQNCDTAFCWYTPQVEPQVFAQAQDTQRDAFLPEQRAGQLSVQKSKLYADNPYAVADRNPVRVVFIPRDEQGVPVKLELPPEIETEVELITAPESVLTDEVQFYDFVSQQPRQAEVQFKVGQEFNLQTEIYFAPNCKTNLKHCFSHPQQAWWYFRSLVSDKQRRLRAKLYQFRTY